AWRTVAPRAGRTLGQARIESSRWSEVVGLIPLFGHPDHGHEPHPLSLIRHRDQLLPMPAPFDVASHAAERPADRAAGRVAIPADRVRTSAAWWCGWLRLGTLAILVERGMGPGSSHPTAGARV